MSKLVQAMGLLAGMLLLPMPVSAQELPALKSVNVDLPPGDSQFPGGAAADAINNNCLACHSADMVLNQPALQRAQWDAEVIKMHTAYKAPIDPKDVDAILDYLVSIKSVK